MKRFLQIGLVLGMILSLRRPAMLASGSNPELPTITIRIYDYAGIPDLLT